jgi:hypothetical protein
VVRNCQSAAPVGCIVAIGIAVSSCVLCRLRTFVCIHRVCSVTSPSWLASVYSTCSRPSPTSDFYTRYNSSERVRRQRTR